MRSFLEGRWGDRGGNSWSKLGRLDMFSED